MENEWTLVEHLTDLRKRVIYSGIVMIVAFALALLFVNRIFGVLEYPLGNVRLAVLGPGDVIQIYFMIAGLVALGVSLPFLLYQVWRFVKPALNPKESKFALSMLPFTLLMFVAGVSFSYFVTFPILLHFLLTLANKNFTVVLTAQKYFGFLTSLTLPFGLIFETPIALLFLTQIGVITPAGISKMRKYAYLVIICIASIISPPEIISHLSVAVPMMALYEASILLCRVHARRMARREAREMQFESISNGRSKGGSV